MYKTFQEKVWAWVTMCLGMAAANDKKRRRAAFTEEAFECFQALGIREEELVAMMKHVYSRPRGDLYQEIAGLQMTTAALCTAYDINMEQEAMDELARVNEPAMIKTIRFKQSQKPDHIG